MGLTGAGEFGCMLDEFCECDFFFCFSLWGNFTRIQCEDDSEFASLSDSLTPNQMLVFHLICSAVCLSRLILCELYTLLSSHKYNDNKMTDLFFV